jgi:hypothetical protein
LPASVVDECPGCGTGWLLRPPGECDPPTQPGAAQWNGTQLGGVGVGDGFGEECHAQASAGQLGDDAGIADFEGDAGLKAGARAGVVEVGAQAGAPGQADERPVPDGVKADGLVPGQGVAVADGKDQRLVDDDFGGQLRGQRGASRD